MPVTTHRAQITIAYDDYDEYTYKIGLNTADIANLSTVAARAKAINANPSNQLKATFVNDNGGVFAQITGVTIIEENSEVVYGHAL